MLEKIQALQALAQNLTLLYVEDDFRIRTLMQEYLEKFFKKVDVASEGAEGLRLYEQGLYDLVITDLLMPKMNGEEMILKIKESSPHQSILVTTAYSKAEYHDNAIHTLVDGYLTKPFDFMVLSEELLRITQKIAQSKEKHEL